MGQARNHLLFLQPRLLLDRLLQDHKLGRGPACAHGTETIKSLTPLSPQIVIGRTAPAGPQFDRSRSGNGTSEFFGADPTAGLQS